MGTLDYTGRMSYLEPYLRPKMASPHRKRPKYGYNEVYRSCGSCDATCNKPYPVCRTVCASGCNCKRGYVRHNFNDDHDTRCYKKSFCAEFLDPNYGNRRKWLAPTDHPKTLDITKIKQFFLNSKFTTVWV